MSSDLRLSDDQMAEIEASIWDECNCACGIRSSDAQNLSFPHCVCVCQEESVLPALQSFKADTKQV